MKHITSYSIVISVPKRQTERATRAAIDDQLTALAAQARHPRGALNTTRDAKGTTLVAAAAWEGK